MILGKLAYNVPGAPTEGYFTCLETKIYLQGVGGGGLSFLAQHLMNYRLVGERVH